MAPALSATYFLWLLQSVLRHLQLLFQAVLNNLCASLQFPVNFILRWSDHSCVSSGWGNVALPLVWSHFIFCLCASNCSRQVLMFWSVLGSVTLFWALFSSATHVGFPQLTPEHSQRTWMGMTLWVCVGYSGTDGHYIKFETRTLWLAEIDHLLLC